MSGASIAIIFFVMVCVQNSFVGQLFKFSSAFNFCFYDQGEPTVEKETSTADLENCFNHRKQLFGHTFNIMILDTEIATEGISLLGAQWLLMTDIPRNYAEFRQIVRFSSPSLTFGCSP